ncbi:MAG: hypothetical protein CMN28_14915 [Salinisphaeraceae bacterium]|jgi:hypothetical protein|nr:hypothetical protein [Salinisphaeraceae bacterium]
MVGHGSIIMLIALAAGFGLTASLLGGLEFIPGIITQFEIPGSPEAWARTHAGGLLNGIMVLAVAGVLAGMQAGEKLSRQMFWMVAGAGYANTIFYWMALVSENRAISFADNRHGETSIFAVIGLAPAFIFAVVLMVAFFLLMREAFSSARG